mmetsp:Transcript_10290/g.31460  ORF Transcript_10290/g.31460 Transcript_10290/m.31460 type:complete len:141 (+) Transcript_10290:2131-2553(+)
MAGKRNRRGDDAVKDREESDSKMSSCEVTLDEVESEQQFYASAKLFKDNPRSRAEERARRGAARCAYEMKQQQREDMQQALRGLGPAQARPEINKLKNRSSAKVSRALRNKYIEMLEAEANTLINRLSELQSKVVDKDGQ